MKRTLLLASATASPAVYAAETGLQHHLLYEGVSFAVALVMSLVIFGLR